MQEEIISSSKVIEHIKTEVADYKKMSAERRRLMYEENKSLQVTLVKKDEKICELDNLLKIKAKLISQ